MNATAKNIAIAIFVAGTIALAGCTPAQAPTVEPSKPAAVETAAPVETTKPAEPESATPAGAKTGDVVDDATAKAINGTYIEPMRKDLAVKLSSGENILVKAAEPLPEVVKESMVKDIKKSVPSISNAEPNDLAVATWGQKLAIEESTGRLVAPVSYMQSWNDATGSYDKGWFVGEPASDILGEYPSKDAAVAAVQEWVAKSPAMRAYIVLAD
ncbi:hypothetical protein [Microbacterium sp. 77mftsu3.1]|uniref:hypothetical protein n=1 Tax=Microbacterium sp. 77mftsu3.1 TaxID=1761802 RepID=UPI00037E0B8A|nr:hypothetical protein [Microbacterium sp. 77mftsu3.1]SDH32809.1 hypothetical protein SAMN04488590_3038 [Microbacterium sp. 77mftsu3.1]